MTSVTNDTTRIRRLPPEYAVATARMPRIDLAGLLASCGAMEIEPVIDVAALRGSFGYGIPKYRPPTFARLYAAARFNCPRAFAVARVALLVVVLLASVPLPLGRERSLSDVP